MKQKQKVMDFRKQVQPLSLHWTYRTQAEFRRLFGEHFGGWIEDEIKAAAKARAKRPKTPTPPRRKGEKPPLVFVTTPPPPKVVRAKLEKNAGVPALRRSATIGGPTSGSARLILLGDDIFHAKSVNEKQGVWTVVIQPQSNAQSNTLRGLSDRQKRYDQHRFADAKELLGGLVTVEDGERTGDDKGDFWTLQLRFTPVNNSMGAISINGLSSDEIAQKRAEWLLLAQNPETKASENPWGSGHDRWLESQIMGSGKEGEPIFPALWKQFQGDTTVFLPATKLWAVYRLLSSGTCGEITELKLGPLTKGNLTVSFRGRRPRQYQNQEPGEIRVKGVCALDT